MATKNDSKERKAKIAQMQREAKAAERRRTLTVVAAVVAVVVLMAGAVTYAIVTDTSRVPGGALTSLGVSAAAAACDPVTTDAPNGSGEHVGPGTSKPNETRVKYTTVPPSSGPHYAAPEYPNREFYTVADRPRIEALVHNLEHGYTLLWYDSSTTTEQLATLKAIAAKANATTAARNKFIVSAWDNSYGTFPPGKHFALSHWSGEPGAPTKQAGHRQLCGNVSGAVVNSFVMAYPLTSAPEAGAQ